MLLENKRKKRKIWIVCAIAALLLAVLPLALDSRLLIRTYTLETEKISSPVRIALVTDLHSCRYGEGQVELLDAIHTQKPDVILLGGDIFDDEIDDTYTEVFLAGIAGKYPIFYVTGNHEWWSGAEAFGTKMAILEKYGIPVLSQESVTLNIRGEKITICGVDDPESYLLDSAALHYDARLDQVLTEAAEEQYTVLLAHRPEYFPSYAARDFDLTLCGHAHGGQWRIPYVLNGLIAPNQGLFPQYAGGLYEKNGTTMIVSRGLARETTWVPRIFNRPELVIVEIQ
jgi:predicted MPP superfamily phosphohydrolase